MNNFAKIIQRNLNRLYAAPIACLEQQLPCTRQGDELFFAAFGTECRITPQGIYLDGQPEEGPRGIVITLYALHHAPDKPVLQPFRAFKELPDSLPYAGAFTQHTETILVPHVPKIEAGRRMIRKTMAGEDVTGPGSGDFAFQVCPLPKIILRYIFYHADEDFPASATCLFSQNAVRFMPVDALAVMAEFTSRRILELSE